MAYPVFATIQDLESYTGKSQVELGSTAELTTALSRASEVVSYSMGRNYISTNADHVEAAKLATCCQVQFWLDNNISFSTESSLLNSYTAGSLSVSMNPASPDYSYAAYRLCSAASMYLRKEYLTYRGLFRR